MVNLQIFSYQKLFNQHLETSNRQPELINYYFSVPYIMRACSF